VLITQIALSRHRILLAGIALGVVLLRSAGVVDFSKAMCLHHLHVPRAADRGIVVRC
jgi:hypothetical protein